MYIYMPVCLTRKLLHNLKSLVLFCFTYIFGYILFPSLAKQVDPVLKLLWDCAPTLQWPTATPLPDLQGSVSV